MFASRDQHSLSTSKDANNQYRLDTCRELRIEATPVGDGAFDAGDEATHPPRGERFPPPQDVRSPEGFGPAGPTSPFPPRAY